MSAQRWNDDDELEPQYIQRPGASYPPPTSVERIITVNQTNFKELMSLKLFKGQDRSALAGFKSRWNMNEWMQGQWGYVERACLAAASGLAAGRSYCQCGLAYFNAAHQHRFQTCGQEYICPSCNLHNRVEPCEREYLSIFDGKRYIYALSVSWQSSPLKAGLHWVTKQDDKGRAKAKKHWRPFADRVDAPHTYRYGADEHAVMALMAELPFKFAKALRKHGWFDGLYCVFEWDFAFHPGPDGCSHSCLPHMHCFGNRAQPLTIEDGIEIQKLYQRTAMRHLDNQRLPAYPDLEISPILTRERLKGWMNYMIKSMPIEKFYLEGIRNGCRLTALNTEFHQTIWDAISLVHSPRRYGNLFALTPGYIGVQQFRKLSKTVFARLCQKAADGLALTPKEKRQLGHHALACVQQKQYAAETKQRRELAKLKKLDSDLKPPAEAATTS